MSDVFGKKWEVVDMFLFLKKWYSSGSQHLGETERGREEEMEQ